MADKKYYWLKLKRDFFKRHDIQIIEDMPNGKDYVLFYLKLLAESVDHDGALRFSDTIPYNEQMLSTITKTNIDIVRSAMKIFSQLDMVDMLDDKTIYMNEIQCMLGSETHWAEKKRQQRLGQCPQKVLHASKMSKEEIETDKEKDKDYYSGGSLSESEMTALADGLNSVLDAAKAAGFPDTSATWDKLNLIVADNGADAVLAAIDICVEANVCNLRYLKGILNKDKQDDKHGVAPGYVG